MPDFFPEDNVALAQDDPARSLKKINDLLYSGGGSGGGGGLSGHGNPEGVTTGTVGQSYLDVDTGVVYWKLTGTGNTGWN